MPTDAASVSDNRRCIDPNPHTHSRVESALFSRASVKGRFIEAFISAFLFPPMYGRIGFSHNVCASMM